MREGQLKPERKGKLLVGPAAHGLRYDEEGKSGDGPAHKRVISDGGRLKSDGCDGTYWAEELDANRPGQPFIVAFMRWGFTAGLSLQVPSGGALMLRRRRQYRA
jgi:hypothetical protein